MHCAVESWCNALCKTKLQKQQRAGDLLRVLDQVLLEQGAAKGFWALQRWITHCDYASSLRTRQAPSLANDARRQLNTLWTQLQQEQQADREVATTLNPTELWSANRAALAEQYRRKESCEQQFLHEREEKCARQLLAAINCQRVGKLVQSDIGTLQDSSTLPEGTTMPQCTTQLAQHNAARLHYSSMPTAQPDSSTLACKELQGLPDVWVDNWLT